MIKRYGWQYPSDVAAQRVASCAIASLHTSNIIKKMLIGFIFIRKELYCMSERATSDIWLQF